MAHCLGLAASPGNLLEIQNIRSEPQTYCIGPHVNRTNEREREGESKWEREEGREKEKEKEKERKRDRERKREREIYHRELAYMIMEADKGPKIHSANQKEPRRASVAVPVQGWWLKTQTS